MLPNARCIVPVMIVAGLSGPASADVITDWNEKTVALVAARTILPPQAERVVASVHVAMFDAVNSIERRYLPYRVQFAGRQGDLEGGGGRHGRGRCPRRASAERGRRDEGGACHLSGADARGRAQG